MSTELIGRWIDHRIIRAGPEAPRKQLCLVRPWADEVVSSYTITFAAFIITAGALGDRIGAKRISWQVRHLHRGMARLRVGTHRDCSVGGQGDAGTGRRYPCSERAGVAQPRLSDERGRGRAAGIWAAGASVALISGPLIGGGLIALVGWRSIFLVNLPIGLAGLWLSWRYVTETTRSPQREFDLPGQIAAIVSLGCLAGGIIEGGARPWSDDFVIAGFGRILAESAAKVMGSPLAIPSFFEIKESDGVRKLSEKNRILFFRSPR
jgi:MFS family permease